MEDQTRNHFLGGLLALLLSLCPISAAHAQIFVVNYFGNTIGEYNATTGPRSTPR